MKEWSFSFFSQRRVSEDIVARTSRLPEWYKGTKLRSQGGETPKLRMEKPRKTDASTSHYPNEREAKKYQDPEERILGGKVALARTAWHCP